MSSKELIKVMVVDDHPVVRAGLRVALNDACDMEVVGEARDGVEAVGMAETVTADVIVMDVIMPNKDGVEACREIRDLMPDTRVLMLTASTEENAVIEAVAAGASGYLLKYSGEEELIAAVRDVAGGRLLLPDDTVRRVFEDIRRDERRSAGDPNKLTEIERQVLRQFASGRTYAQIAEIRGNSSVTVRNTLYRIQDKLRLATKQEIVVWAVRNGLLDDDGHEPKDS